MCLIIDTNTLSKVFKKSNKDHGSFQAVLNWIIDGNGKIIIGGTTFKNELTGNIKWFLPLLSQLAKVNKVVIISDLKVNEEERKIRQQIVDPDFDDPHIIALILKSKTKLVCTQDKRSYKYINDKTLYPKRSKTPAIYSGKANKNLLCDSNICACCKPNTTLPKRSSNGLLETLELLN